MPVINNYIEQYIWNHIIRVHQIGTIDIGSYQSGSQLVLLPIWLPIGAVTNLAPNWYSSVGTNLAPNWYSSVGTNLAPDWCFYNDVMTSEVEYRTTSSRRHCTEKVPIWRYQFGFELVVYYQKWNTITNWETNLESFYRDDVLGVFLFLVLSSPNLVSKLVFFRLLCITHRV
jgi:hypothetical protein